MDTTTTYDGYTYTEVNIDKADGNMDDLSLIHI